MNRTLHTRRFVAWAVGLVMGLVATASPATASHLANTGEGAGNLVAVNLPADREVNQDDNVNNVTGAGPGDGIPDYFCATLKKQTVTSNPANTYVVAYNLSTNRVLANVSYSLVIGVSHENPSGTYANRNCTGTVGATAPVSGSMSNTVASTRPISCTYGTGSTYKRHGLVITLRLVGSCTITLPTGSQITRNVVEDHVGVGYFGTPHTTTQVTGCVPDPRVPNCDYNDFPLPSDDVHWADTMRATAS